VFMRTRSLSIRDGFGFAKNDAMSPLEVMTIGRSVPMRSWFRGHAGRVALGLLLLGCASPLQAEPTKQGPVFTITEENDLFLDTDRHYTQGLKFTYMFGDDEVPDFAIDWAMKLPALGYTVEHAKAGISVGQSIFTPGDISIPTLIPADRPYAGWLYLGLILQRHGTNEFLGQIFGQHRSLENLEISLGVVGPWALGEEAQTWIHRLRGFDLPQGWDNQLRNEPAIQLRYTRMWNHRSPAGWEPFAIDLIPHWGLSAGTVHVFGNIGATLRMGLNLPQDFGTTTIDAPTVESGVGSGSKWGVYAFVGVDGRAVAWNTFLDGNLFHDSHSVDKRHLVGDFKLGGVLVLKRVELGYTYILRSEEYLEQRQRDGFGSLSLKWKF
jgi:lipid A 3-O-deacylase